MPKETTQSKEPKTKTIEPPVMSESMEEIKHLICARTPLIYVQTAEEDRFIEEFNNCIAKDPNIRYSTFCWTSYKGLVPCDKRKEIERVPDSGDDMFAKTYRPDKALSVIRTLRPRRDADDNNKHEQGIVVIMQDLHQVLQTPIIRQLRDSLPHLVEFTKTVIVTAPVTGPRGEGLPPELEKDFVLVNYKLPTPRVLREVTEVSLNNLLKSASAQLAANPKDPRYKNIKLKYTNEDYTRIVRAGQGLTIPEMNNAIAVCWVRDREIIPDKILKEKEQIVRKTDILECVGAKIGLKDIGGMDTAKEYFKRYTKAFSDDAKQFGVKAPNGFLLTGVPGTGKSLFAKAMAALWGIPLLRLDIGKVMTGLVGGSEEKMRAAIKSAEAMSPCILWIDEVEKAVGGVKSSHHSDSGTLARVFGTLLTWMQEKEVEVSVVATANDFTILPPEFIRRFTETFFMDLPTDEERKEIWSIHIKKPREAHPGRDVNKFDLDALANASPYYTGAEIEKCVENALATAFASGAKDVTTDYLLQAARETQPLYKVMSEKVQEMRTAARGRFIYASSKAADESAIGKQSVKTADGGSLSLEDLNEDLGSIDLKAKEEKKPKKTH